MSKVLYGAEGREKLKAGIDILANAVKVTLGPKGRNVVMNKQFRPGHVTKDGVTVAREIELEDPVENMGAQMVKEVASRTADMAGDGTTTATVLAQKMYSDGIKLIQSGFNPIQMKAGMDLAKDKVIAELVKLSKGISTEEELTNIATVSANNDKTIGDLLGKAFNTVGRNGLVVLQEGKTADSYLKFLEGLEIDKGYISPHFINTADKDEVIFENPYIFIASDVIEVIADILPTLEYCIKQNKPLLIIAKEISDELLQTLVVNKIQSGIKVCVIKAPGFGESCVNYLEDIALATGGVMIDSRKGIAFTDVDEAYLGKATKVTIKSQKTTLIGLGGKKEDIDGRVSSLLLKYEGATSYDQQTLSTRISKLTGNACTIYIGANSDVELKEKKDRYDDAMNAVKSAIEEGVIPGGGSALVYISNRLIKLKGSNESENAGIKVVLNSIKEPFRQILNNGEISSDYYLKKLESAKYGIGLNLKSNKVENLLTAGIIDPVKVARLGVENAVSIVGTLLTTEAIIY